MSNVTTHTAGPWRIVRTNNGLFVAGSSPGYFAEVFYGDRTTNKSFPEQHANAALIAAAPDLLEACREFVRKVESGEAKSVRSYEQMKAAIAKADERP